MVFELVELISIRLPFFSGNERVYSLKISLEFVFVSTIPLCRILLSPHLHATRYETEIQWQAAREKKSLEQIYCMSDRIN